jgi:hypothetical protein
MPACRRLDTAAPTARMEGNLWTASMAEPAPPIADALRLAGHDLPPQTLLSLDGGHALLQAMLARLGATAAEAEQAATFRPDGPR